MGKLDKKVLKILKTRQFEDLDAVDIAMQLKVNDEKAQEALDSLKEQGLVECLARDGKSYWRLPIEESIEKPEESDAFSDRDPMHSDTVSFDISKLKSPAETIKEPAPRKDSPQLNDEFFPVSEQIKPVAVSQPRPSQPQAPEPVKSKTEIPIPPPPIRPEPIQVKTEIPIAPPSIVKKEPHVENTRRHPNYEHEDDDADDVRRSTRKTLPFSIIGIAIAVVFSVVVSAVVAMMIASNTNKGISSGLGELEKKVSETNVKQDQKIDALSQKVKSIAEKPAAPQIQAKPAVPSRAIKPIVTKPIKQVVKRHPVPRKKKGKSPESVTSSSPEENTSSTLTPSPQETSPSSEVTSPASEPPTPPPASEPESSPPPSSPEGSNQ